jgi:hypothetical protein
LPALEHHTCREDDVEVGGIKIKKKQFFDETGNFLGQWSEKIKFKFIFIPNHHFWMSPQIDNVTFSSLTLTLYNS